MPLRSTTRRVTSGVTLFCATRMRRTSPVFTAVVAGHLGRDAGKVEHEPWRRRIGHLHGRRHELAVTLEGDQHVAVLARGAEGGQCAGGVGVRRCLGGLASGHMGGHASERVDHQALSILDLLLDLAGLPEQS